MPKEGSCAGAACFSAKPKILSDGLKTAVQMGVDTQLVQPTHGNLTLKESSHKNCCNQVICMPISNI